MNELVNEFLEASMMDHVRGRLEAIDEELKHDDQQYEQPHEQHTDTHTQAAPSSPSFYTTNTSDSALAHRFANSLRTDEQTEEPEDSAASPISPPPPPPLDTRNLSAASDVPDVADARPPLIETVSQPPPHYQSSSTSSASPSSIRPPGISRAYSEPNPNAPADIVASRAPVSPSSIIHRGVTCDNCTQSPLRGPRWKCRQCADFDLCSRCHLLNPSLPPHLPSHTYQLFTQPRPDPLVCALTDFLHLILASGFISVRMIGGVPTAADNSSVLEAVLAASMQGGTHHVGTRPAAVSVREELDKIEVGESVAGAMCVVCQEALKVGELSTFLPSCHHFFHYDCIVPWLERHSECPTCRAKMKDVDEEEAENKAKDPTAANEDELKESVADGSRSNISSDRSGQVIHRYTANRTACPRFTNWLQLVLTISFLHLSVTCLVSPFSPPPVTVADRLAGRDCGLCSLP